MTVSRRLLPLLLATPTLVTTPMVSGGLALGGLVSGGLISGAQAQPDWPARGVSIVVPWPAGGSTDSLVRTLAQHLSTTTGQPFLVDNRPGATGTLGHAYVARARGDGYTLLAATNSTYAIAPHLMASLPYDNETAFAPISFMATNPQLLVTHPAQPFATFPEFLAHARANPGRLSFASSGIGGTSHLATELMMDTARITMLHVPYRGGAPAAQAQLAGEVQVTFVDAITAIPHLRAGTMRALGVSTATRTALAPDVPTIADSGLPGFESSTDFALLAPADMTPALVQRIYTVLASALADTGLRDRLLAQGMTPVAGKPEEFRAYQQRESAKWGAIIRSRNIRIG